MLPKPNIPWPWLSLGSLSILLALSPLAMSLLPYAGIYTELLWQADLTKDPAWGLRSALIYCGFVLPWVPLAQAVWYVRTKRGVPIVASTLALWFACAVLGWRNFPYWVSGVYAQSRGLVPWADMDPTPLLRPIYGSSLLFWQILAVYPAVLWVPPVALVGAYLLWKENARGSAVVPVLATVLGLYFMFAHTPGYLSWFMD